MPTYEYACTACGHRVEVVQSFSEAPLEKCERCGGKLRRVFHPVGVLFKGSGFYRTDSGGKRKSDSKSSKDGSDTSKPKKKDPKKDSKTEVKKDTKAPSSD